MPQRLSDARRTRSNSVRIGRVCQHQIPPSRYLLSIPSNSSSNPVLIVLLSHVCVYVTSWIWCMYSRLVLQSSEQKAPALLRSDDSDVKKRRWQLAQHVCRWRHWAPPEPLSADLCLRGRSDFSLLDTDELLGIAILVLAGGRLAWTGFTTVTQSSRPGQDLDGWCCVHLRRRKMN